MNVPKRLTAADTDGIIVNCVSAVCNSREKACIRFRKVFCPFIPGLGCLRQIEHVLKSNDLDSVESLRSKAAAHGFWSIRPSEKPNQPDGDEHNDNDN